MSCEIDNDFGESPECFSEKDRVARKPHVCFECGRTIEKGETYRYESGIWDGEPRSYKTCSDCLSIRDAFFCHFIFGSIWDDLSSMISYNEEISSKKLDMLTPTAKNKVIELFDKLTKNDEFKES